MPDVMIVGGGVIGLSCALELARHGLTVTVIDQSAIGREASWAGAGIIPPGDHTSPDLHQLALLSSKLWPDLSADLLQRTGIDNGYRPCQGILVPEESAIDAERDAWRGRGVRVEDLNSTDLREHIPVLNPEIARGLLLPDQAQVRNPRHLKALIAACQMAGVELIEQQKVHGWETSGGRVLAAKTDRGTLSAGEFLVTAGSWSDLVCEPVEITLGIRPIRGQIVLLNAGAPLFRQTIEYGRCYLVPREDGRILAGATEEDVGFLKLNTPEAVESLTKFARWLIPGLSETPVETTWSGLRPFRENRPPVIGRADNWSNLTLAAGHYRAGLSNSPGTAVLVRQIIRNEPPALDLAAFAVR